MSHVSYTNGQVVTHPHLTATCTSSACGYAPWLNHTWHDVLISDMTHWHVTWRIHIWHDSLIHIWYDSLIDIFRSDKTHWHMTHWHVTWRIHMWHDSFVRDMTHLYEIWLIWWDMTHTCQRKGATMTSPSRSVRNTTKVRGGGRGGGVWRHAGIARATEVKIGFEILHTRTLSHKHTDAYRHTRAHYLTHTCAHRHSRTLAHTLTHIHTHAHTLTNVHTHSQTHRLADTQTHRHRHRYRHRHGHTDTDTQTQTHRHR